MFDALLSRSAGRDSSLQTGIQDESGRYSPLDPNLKCRSATARSNQSGYNLKERRSAKKKYVNQVSVQLATDDNLFPVHVQNVLEAVAEERGERMPEAMIVGYSAANFSPNLPGQWHSSSALHEMIFKLGKKIGKTLS